MCGLYYYYSGTGSGGKTAVGIGALLAVGGLGYAYYKHGDDEMIHGKINFLKESIGLAKPTVSTSASPSLAAKNQ
jgi:hypothetical protein